MSKQMMVEMAEILSAERPALAVTIVLPSARTGHASSEDLKSGPADMTLTTGHVLVEVAEVEPVGHAGEITTEVDVRDLLDALERVQVELETPVRVDLDEAREVGATWEWTIVFENELELLEGVAGREIGGDCLKDAHPVAVADVNAQAGQSTKRLLGDVVVNLVETGARRVFEVQDEGWFTDKLSKIVA